VNFENEKFIVFQEIEGMHRHKHESTKPPKMQVYILYYPIRQNQLTKPKTTNTCRTTQTKIDGAILPTKVCTLK